MRKTLMTVALGLAICLAMSPMALADEIKVGGIFDQTGPTGAVGSDYQKGAVAATKYWNDKGGVAGTMLDLISNDYAYKIPEAVSLYKKYTTVDKVFVIQGWGTGE